MKTIRQIFCNILVVILLASCTGNNYLPATTALEGGREFIDACLKGDFDKAAFYMINDGVNAEDLLKIKRDYNLKSSDEKYNYGSASIIINADEMINDSTHIINYKNSYDKIARKVKVIKRNDKWLVDFKYTFDGNL